MKWDDLTPQQRVALRWPCYFAVETAHPRYIRTTPFCTLLVTVNTGYE
jgi:hypothetical protein